MKKKINKRFICFIGIDGSGKTTVSKSIVENLKKNGNKAGYIWLNTVPIFIKPIRFLSQKFILNNKDIHRDYEGYTALRKEKANRNKLLRKIYYLIVFVDYFIWVYYNFFSMYFQRKIIICDRYVYDLAVNLGNILGYNVEKVIKLTQSLLFFLPKPDLVILLDVDESTAFKRKSDTPHINYLLAHRPVYREIASYFNFKVVDASQNLDYVLSNVKEIISL